MRITAMVLLLACSKPSDKRSALDEARGRIRLDANETYLTLEMNDPLFTCAASPLVKRGDPWGSAYDAVCEPTGLRFASLGPDKVRGTADDVRVVCPRSTRTCVHE